MDSRLFKLAAYKLCISYPYDSLRRLSEAKEISGTTQTWIQNFGYDRFGNRTSFNQQKIGTSPISQIPTIDSNKNRFTAGQGFTYDPNGNLISDNQGSQFIFNGDNKQIEVKDAANNTIGLYLYDGSGKRVKKITATELIIFVYNAGGRLVAEYSTNLSASPTTSYLTNDIIGSPRVITNNGGIVTSRRDFMPFGEELYAGTANRTEPNKYSPFGQDNVRKRFTGYEKDTETDLDFAEARMYNNQHGRFTTVDPLLASGNSSNPQTFNRYAYVANNPIILTDPTGMFIEAWSHGGMLFNWGSQSFDNPFHFQVENVRQQQQAHRPLTMSQRLANRFAETLRQRNIEAFDDRLFAIARPFLIGVPAPSDSSNNTSSGVGYGRVISFSRTAIVWYWYWRQTGTKIADAAVTNDETNADIVYSPQNVGVSKTKDALFGVFGNDDAGHIIAAALGGDGLNSRNITSMDQTVNRSRVKKLEYEIRRILTADQTLTARITVSLSYSKIGFFGPGAALASPDYIKFRPESFTYDVRFVNPQGQVVNRVTREFWNIGLPSWLGY